ncbi:uncharacterized protein YALI1_F21056g [Yarrowia lipolytica]|uniref:Uncharacterized protein n=1 Tax=Yarrowia lipolytica TaxID=4952 RepID=A0A1D8NNN1_YARLL|nr:hypothetical protein YALI1_F21056g [Yarrowia lipolytica]
MTVQTTVHPSKAFRRYYPYRELHPRELPILSESSWTFPCPSPLHIHGDRIHEGLAKSPTRHHPASS